MNLFKHIPGYIPAAGLLFLIGLVFLTCFRGYTYMGATFFFLAALVLLHHFLPVKYWRIVAALVCVGLAYFSVLELLIIGASGGDRDTEKKYLVVLGAAVLGDRPSLALTHRLEGALSYLETYPESYAILSGGKGNGEYISEAQCMYNWLTAYGIDPQRLILEDRSTSTRENLVNSFDIIRLRGDVPDDNVMLVSSAYHLYRAKCIARNLGVDVCAVPGNPGYPVYMLNCYIREAFGLTHLMVFGY